LPHVGSTLRILHVYNFCLDLKLVGLGSPLFPQLESLLVLEIETSWLTTMRAYRRLRHIAPILKELNWIYGTSYILDELTA
jgi:hypothetical protein